jgi:hypothetical protein
MNHHRVALAMFTISAFVVCGQWASQAAAQVNVDVGGVHVRVGGQPQPPEVVEVLTRGPVHEAFAQPVMLDEGAAFMITHRPPAPIEEVVPQDKPEGNHIVWIPGYWGWDTDRDDFIWVSGCWRAVPPSNSWVPGYWAQTKGGYQWIAGFWTAADSEEIEYLPAPPATLEEGPQGAGSADSIWIPGCWIRHEGHYAWRPGFWEKARPNWVWSPAYYASTPRGCVYVEGYWDYPLERRGVAFLPVYCSERLYSRADFRYSPEIVLDLNALTVNLFISPGRHHYYFGDYYGTEYSRSGYRPWYEVRDHHDWYDPIFVHQQWQHRDDHQWAQHQREAYDSRRDDKALRPARTYEAMRAQAARLPEKDRQQAQFARPMKEVVSQKNAPFKYETLDTKRREETVNHAKEARDYKDKRSQWESTPASVKPGPEVSPREPVRTTPNELPMEPAKHITPTEQPRASDHGAVPKEQPAAQDVKSERVKIPKSPVAVREQVRDKDQTPPPRPEHPKTDPSAKARPAKDDTPDRSKDNGGPDKHDSSK